MHVEAIKTPIIKAGEDLLTIIANTIPSLPEKSVLVIASKAVATWENRFVPKVTGEREEKFELARKEADFYLDPHSSKYGLMLTIKDNWMFVSAGIDESNADDQYLLWPKNPQLAATKIWQFLRQHYGLKEVGVILSDSRSLPLNWGVTVHGIAFCGFECLKSYIGKPDLFGRKMKMEQVNMMQSIAAAGGLEMGEGAESTPLAIVSEVRDLVFTDHAPTEKELAELKINPEDDVYAPLLQGVDWKRGGSGR